MIQALRFIAHTAVITETLVSWYEALSTSVGGQRYYREIYCRVSRFKLKVPSQPTWQFKFPVPVYNTSKALHNVMSCSCLGVYFTTQDMLRRCYNER